ncbi:hypothetical protein SINU_11120 [Sporolactobacillus inulinus CASD]|uniref:Uncharacterized protein n=1 Tax=Sporolactobacillus inulinus CASD TaxID=1069536 RepID=A0A0U1QLY9_9BACL|nr:hypothetical protein SINU_11120 [Sporolactobacillus inulinus CASD]
MRRRIFFILLSVILLGAAWFSGRVIYQKMLRHRAAQSVAWFDHTWSHWRSNPQLHQTVANVGNQRITYQDLWSQAGLAMINQASFDPETKLNDATFSEKALQAAFDHWVLIAALTNYAQDHGMEVKQKEAINWKQMVLDSNIQSPVSKDSVNVLVTSQIEKKYSSIYKKEWVFHYANNVINETIRVQGKHKAINEMKITTQALKKYKPILTKNAPKELQIRD